MSSKKNTKWLEVKMDYLRYMDLDEISRKFGVSKNTLKSRIRRGNWRQERELMEEEVGRRVIEELIADGKKPLLQAQEEWHQASLKMYQELIDKVKHCTEKDELNILLVHFMTFCEMNKLVYQPENPETVYVVR